MRFMSHEKPEDNKSPGNIVIRGNDTDIFIILLKNVQKLSQGHLWFDTGVDSDNSRNYVDIPKLSKELDFAKALPGIYAYWYWLFTCVLHKRESQAPLINDKRNKHSWMHSRLFST